VSEDYIQIIRHAGDWSHRARIEVELIDLVNLGLYHAIKELNPQADLPPLNELAAYNKLQAPLNFIDEQGELTLLSSHRDEIYALAATLR
jgi:hypothetical protein